MDEPSPSAALPLPAPAESPEAPPLRVLWCDPQSERAGAAARALVNCATIEAVSDTDTAIAAARRAAPALVVAAAASGEEAEKRFAALRAGRIVAPVVLWLPGRAEAADAARRLATRPRGDAPADYLAGPLPEHELFARLGAQLEIVRLHRVMAETQTESEAWLSLALKSAGVGVWHSRIGSGEVHMDANLAAMFGFRHAPARVREAEWVGAIHLEDRARVIAELAARRADLKPLEIEIRTVQPDGTIRWLAVLGTVLPTGDGAALRSVGVARDITERVRDAERQKLLLRELDHRVRNTLANVLSLAQQTARGASSIPEYLAGFQARVMALASAHNLLNRGNWQGVSLRDLVEATLAPERKSRTGQIEIAGPDCALAPPQALALTLGLHELATNARKYGALSAPQGRLGLTWQITDAAEGRRLRLTWQERDGPPVQPPTRTGFGTRLLERALGADLDGAVRLDFDPAGLRCTIELPLGRVEA